MSEHTDTERLPLAGKLPEKDILVEIFDRITLLSDELNDPDGLLCVKLAAVEKRAAERHEEIKAMFQRALDEVLDVRARQDDVEDQVNALRGDTRPTLVQ